MDDIRVAKVDNVKLIFQGDPSLGTLHVTSHHLIFSHDPANFAPVPPTPQRSTSDVTATAAEGGGEDAAAANTRQKPAPRTPEVWITYPIISSVERRHIGGLNFGAIRSPPGEDQPEGTITPTNRRALAIRIRCKDFNFVTFCFDKEKDAKDVYDSIKNLACCGSIEKLYAFFYKPASPERKVNGWEIYTPEKEFKRQGVSEDWRVSKINEKYTFCDTYPAKLYVPTTISDSVLNYAAKHRSRQRIPVLTYFHNINGCTLTRSSQPLTGVRQNRSVQDERLVLSIFESSHASKTRPPGYGAAPSSSSITLIPTEEEMSQPYNPALPRNVYGAQQTNLIVDARPTINAMAQHAAGAGSENMEYYPFAKKQYLGIDNIHVMRDSLSRVIEAIKDSDLTPFPANRDLLQKSHWLKHIGGLLEGTYIITRQVGLEHSSVLIHCSDGWDRTAQLSALSQICLDPYFRTIKGFMTLVEKDWVSFGFKFVDRCGFLSSEKWFTDAKSSDGDPRQSGVSGIEQTFGAVKSFWDRNKPGGIASPGGTGAESEPLSDTEPTMLDSTTPRKGGGRTSKSPNPGSAVKEISPIFHQFLDATYQLLRQHPKRFEFNERFLRRLLYHLYSCQYGTFLYNTERERKEAKIHNRSRSVWDYFLARMEMWQNSEYDKVLDSDERGGYGRLIFPDGKAVKWWWEAFGRRDDEMNGRKAVFSPERETSSSSSTHVAAAAEATGKREEPTVVEEESLGVVKPADVEEGGSAAAGKTMGSTSEGSAVLGTEASSRLAEAAEEDEKEEAVKEIEKVVPTINVDDKPVQPEEEELQSPLPPVVALEPAEVEEKQQQQGEPTWNADEDPLGGHTAVDVDLSSSSRAAANRSRSRGGGGNNVGSVTPRSSSKEIPTTTEGTGGVERKFEQMEMME